ncbi:MAG TPA: DegT/DnrJ/EryC1/StrS family aminotransferase [Terriglobia bacterium]|nr:DegT/DnrJ/EryC1/StrS family aminotransferase [Terriglobia bacterium]
MKESKLAINGGKPVRKEPLPLEFPGVHHMDQKEIQAAVRVLKSRSLFRYYGLKPQKEVSKLEAEFAEQLGTKYAIGVASGTGALHVALSALGVGPGQEVIVPAYSWVSVLAAVVNLGAIPVLADIDETFCLNPAETEKCITPKTRGIILVHMSGAPGNAKAIQTIARDHKLFLLEDCAQCNGGSIKGKKVGTFGDMAIFSFQLNKNMTAGEGGCVATDNLQLYQRAFACHDLGYARDEHGRLILNNPDLRLWGRGYRLDEMRAAVLRVQLKKMPRIIKAMNHSKYRIRKALEKFPRVQLRKIQDPAGDTGCFLITTYPDAETARKVNEGLRAEGIVTSPQGVSDVLLTSWGLHLYYNNVSLREHASVDRGGSPWKLAENAGLERNYDKGTCPMADSLFERSILIAIPSCLKKRDEDDIIHAFGKVLPVFLPS